MLEIKSQAHVTQSVVNRRSFVQSWALGKFFPNIDDSHGDKIHSSITVVPCFQDGYVGKQPVAWNEYCAEY